MNRSAISIGHDAAGLAPDYPASRLARCYVYCVPLLAVVVALRGGALSAGGFNYTGFLWLAALVAGCLLLLLDVMIRPANPIFFPILPWMLWLGFVMASVGWADHAGFHEIRDVLHWATPVLVGIVASYSIRSREHLSMLIKTYYIALPLLCFPVALWGVFDLKQEFRDDMFVEVRWIGATAIVLGGLFIAETKRRPVRGWVGWIGCLAVTIVTAGRMASLGMLLMPMFNPVVRHPVRKLATCLVMIAAGLVMLATPVFQERFFGAAGGGVNDIVEGNFDSAARFDVWPMVYDVALERPWLGHGVGSSEKFLADMDARIILPHNDYLRVGFELGSIGLALTVGVIVWQLFALGMAIHRTDGVVQQAFAGAWLSLALFLLIAFTGNPISYTLSYMNPVFALIGAAYGVRYQEQALRQREQTATAQEGFLRTPANPWMITPRTFPNG